MKPGDRLADKFHNEVFAAANNFVDKELVMALSNNYTSLFNRRKSAYEKIANNTEVL